MPVPMHVGKQHTCESRLSCTLPTTQSDTKIPTCDILPRAFWGLNLPLPLARWRYLRSLVGQSSSG